MQFPKKVFDLLVNPNAIPKEKDVLHLEWHSSIFNIPIFRRAQGRYDPISPTLSLQYRVFNTQLKKSAQAAGFREELTPYCLQRGSAAAVDAIATTSQ
ncbi:hypothetical protein DFH27DRAFT_618275 [Peziza echinospora]|nr:hypothetical protein DFH27DRAFT_618275 [Peziza echinospora]